MQFCLCVFAVTKLLIFRPHDAVWLRRRGQPGGPGPRGEDHTTYIITHLTHAEPPNLHLGRPKTPLSLRGFNVTAGISGPDTEVLEVLVSGVALFQKSWHQVRLCSRTFSSNNSGFLVFFTQSNGTQVNSEVLQMCASFLFGSVSAITWTDAQLFVQFSFI